MAASVALTTESHSVFLTIADPAYISSPVLLITDMQATATSPELVGIMDTCSKARFASELMHLAAASSVAIAASLRRPLCDAGPLADPEDWAPPCSSVTSAAAS